MLTPSMSRSWKMVVALSLALNVAAGLALAARLFRAPPPPGGPYAAIYRAHRVSLFRALDAQRGAGGEARAPSPIVFLGDSITDGCEWSELLGRDDLVNRGIQGDTTADILARAPLIRAMEPRLVVLLVGVNDLLARRPLEAITADYARILTALGPATLALSVLPLRPALLDDPRTGEEANRLRLELDARIKALALAAGARYADLGVELVDARGELEARYTQDGVHLNGEGYMRLEAALRPYLPGEPRPREAPAK